MTYNIQTTRSLNPRLLPSTENRSTQTRAFSPLKALDTFTAKHTISFSGGKKDWNDMSLKEKMRSNWRNSDKGDFLMNMLGVLTGVTLVACTPFGLLLTPLLLLATGFAFSPFIKALINKKVSKR